MIRQIDIEGFKSFKKVSLPLGGLNLFVGVNASGKSNFFDALRVLQGIGYGFSIDEVLNGKPKSAGSEAWDGIRGGSLFAGFSSPGLEPIGSPSFSVLLDAAGNRRCYSLQFSTKLRLIEHEAIEEETGRLLMRRSSSPGKPMSFLQDREIDFPQIRADIVRTLSNMQRIEPSMSLLRDYSLPPTAPRMGERGENFAALVQTIISEEKVRSAYVSWLRQLTPVELDDVAILPGALGEPLFALKENGQNRAAPILSDGTLRFAAIAAAFFQPDMPDVITLEEIENGLHPGRLRLLLELLKSQSGGPDRPGPQVFATTHSPLVLSWLDESDYATTFLCKRDAETGASVITPLSEIPHLVELARKQPIGDLFAEGWLEGAA